MGIVLCYHSTPSNRVNLLPGEVPIAQLMKHIQVLSLIFKFTNLEQNDKNWRNLTVTFDDGYANNYSAIEALNAKKIPVTVFVSTFYIETQTPFYWDLAALRETDPAEVCNLLKAGSGEKRKTYSIESMELPDIEQSIFNLDLMPLSTDQLKSLSKLTNVEIGNHTETHGSLGLMNSNLAYQEIERGKAQLKNWTGKEITNFAFPFGTSQDVIRINENKLNTWTTSAFPNVQTGDSQLKPRLVVGNWNKLSLIIQILRVFLRNLKREVR